MEKAQGEVVVAGHLCLDLIPGLRDGEFSFQPGQLSEVGAAVSAPGGGVANVGISLHKLGVKAMLLGTIGQDALGNLLKTLFNDLDPDLSAHLLTDENAATSYSVVLSPPGRDRMFLHHSGCNDTFDLKRISPEQLRHARFFYFGYPPLMRSVYEDGGAALAELFAQLKENGVSPVLDMALPDPGGASGRVDWSGFLQRVLPHTTLFMPSFEEICFMLGVSAEVSGQDELLERASDLGGRLLELGVPLVVIKLGERGLHLRTGDAPPPTLNQDWRNRELWLPAFPVEVATTTGAGDAAVAGFLTALLNEASPAQALRFAAAVGALSVRAADATSGVPHQDEVRSVLEDWTVPPHSVAKWRYLEAQNVYVSPNDALF